MKTGPAISVAIANRQTCMTLCGPRLRKAVRAALAGTSVREARISLAVVDDPTIARLNRQFLDHAGPTDVLSFLLEEGPGWIEGEVVVSAETAAREAPHYGWQPQDELLLYVVHGALHLAGHDDRSAADRARMQAREQAVLAELGTKPEGGRRKAEGGRKNSKSQVSDLKSSRPKTQDPRPRLLSALRLPPSAFEERAAR